MINAFKHKGLKLLAEKGDASKLPPEQVSKIRLRLSRLNLVTNVEMMREPGYDLHELSGDRKGTYSVRVTGTYRITFSFDGENAIDVNYEDYH
ncbi:type II toxin-antitoxin system RelE/ParE family toxin [Hymenobacter sp. H14-R3]|uniref:type II toxin-antitoxin system RelE/ParE family toxin n=1 Tax=Hymenobacter sp. H14-R3 TaxID=3046308 RepID=UPI0024B8ADA5|nr:type II toxin-antitoxin system RelE/ParE family toxin [Hymenobacter sp. H14-R3]MDJ0367800.1 type II toxin-antitoxin system RelE/ParE family toxin [Hymenobacter sp. H14-R3]